VQAALSLYSLSLHDALPILSRADLADAAKRLRKFGARNDAVENIVAGSEAAKSAKGVLAAFPEKFAFGVVAGKADFAGVVGVRRSEEHTSELQSRFDLVCRL